MVEGFHCTEKRPTTRLEKCIGFFGEQKLKAVNDKFVTETKNSQKLLLANVQNLSKYLPEITLASLLEYHSCSYHLHKVQYSSWSRAQPTCVSWQQWSGEQSRISWVYSQKVVRTNEIARSVNIT